MNRNLLPFLLAGCVAAFVIVLWGMMNLGLDMDASAEKAASSVHTPFADASDTEGELAACLRTMADLEARLVRAEQLLAKAQGAPSAVKADIPLEAKNGSFVEDAPAITSGVTEEQWRQLDDRLRALEQRFNELTRKIQVSTLSPQEQVELAVNSPFGNEMIKKLVEMQEKLDSVLTKRMVDGALSGYEQVYAGVWGNYYKDRWFHEKVAGQVDSQLNFNWHDKGPGVLNGQGDQFSIRWEGVLRITKAGKYSFYTVTDDGIRLWVGKQLVLAEYDDHAPKEDLVEVDLKPGDYPLELEYYENGGIAVMQLYWRLDGGEKELIPASHLFHTLEQERD